MKRLRPARLALPLLLVAVLTSAAAAQEPATRPTRGTASYDGRSVIIDGKPVLVYSGAFHYFRCPKPLWRDRFEKIKAAGFNAVETYVPWNDHEIDRPTNVNDTSNIDLTDLKDWLRMAQDEFGLYTIVRPGPYICAEWAGGGFPGWLLDERPEMPQEKPWLRTADPKYLAWCKHWFDAVCPVIAAEQVTRKPAGRPGVILFQIENEYDFYPNVSDDDRRKQLEFLLANARRNGIDVPVFTCWTRQARDAKPGSPLAEVFDTLTLYPRWDMRGAGERLGEVRRQQPGAPVGVVELQGGWFSGVGGQLAEDQNGLSAGQINHVTLYCIQEEATVLNYYMLFGGTNFSDTAARNITASYDYAAPITEPGGGGAKYRAVRAIGAMLKEVGPELLRSERVDAKAGGLPDGVEIAVRRAVDGARFVFCRNKDSEHGRSGTAKINLGEETLTVPFDLEPGGFRVLRLPPGEADAAKGKWMPEPIPAPARPKVPDGVRLATAMTRTDDGVASTRPVVAGTPLIHNGIYDSRYVVYRAAPTLDAAAVEKLKSLLVELFTDDSAVLRVNGKIVLPAGEARNRLVFPVAGALKVGANEIDLLYENAGQPNFTPAIENVGGVRRAVLMAARGANGALEAWRVKKVPDGGGADLVGPGVDDSAWASFTLDGAMVSRLRGPLQNGVGTPADAAARVLFDTRDTAVFRTAVELSADELKRGMTELVFENVDDVGQVYVNGKKVGETREARRRVAFDAKAALKPGRNVIAVIVSNPGGYPGGILGPAYLEQPAEGVDLDLNLSPQMKGVADGWADVKADTAGWKRVGLDTEKAVPEKGSDAPDGKADALMTWYRMAFELPATDPKIWVPWRADVDASGDGFVYLNGHCLGRYWQRGPQRRFYLPECWLNFGPGAANVLTVALRPTERGAVLRAADVRPYADQAEYRAAPAE